MNSDPVWTEHAKACSRVQHSHHLSVSKEGLEHCLHRVRSDMLLNSEGAHGHVWPKAPLVQQRLNGRAAKRTKLCIWQMVKLEVVVGLLLTLLFNEHRHERWWRHQMCT